MFNGADGETRTLTIIHHSHLKAACLPIPPRRLNPKNLNALYQANAQFLMNVY